MPAPRLAIIADPDFTLHDTSNPRGVADRDPAFGHPERPDRLRAIHRALRQSGLLASPDPFPTFNIELGDLPKTSTPAPELAYRPAEDKDLLLIHPQSHLDKIARHCRQGLPLDEDTPVGNNSDEIARKSVGAALAAVDAAITRKADRVFVAGRPPGHHATPTRAMGFCLYSTIAIAALHALTRHNLSNVAIFDFDVHHGNGTQAALSHEPRALFISTHQSPQTCYPGTGFASENNDHTLNLPLDPGTGHEAYLAVLKTKVLPALKAQNPQLILLSAGFDAHTDDPLAQLDLTESTYADIARMLAGTFPTTPVVALLEGGYHLKALARSVTHFLLELQK